MTHGQSTKANNHACMRLSVRLFLKHQEHPIMPVFAVPKSETEWSMEIENEVDIPHGAPAFSRLLLYKHFFPRLECSFLHQHSVLYFSKMSSISRHGYQNWKAYYAYGVVFLPLFALQSVLPKTIPDLSMHLQIFAAPKTYPEGDHGDEKSLYENGMLRVRAFQFNSTKKLIRKV